ncbi:hypothetical protein D3C87_618350 [compost metagenome]
MTDVDPNPDREPEVEDVAMSDTRPKPEKSKDLEAWRSEQRPSGSRQPIVPFRKITANCTVV